MLRIYLFHREKSEEKFDMIDIIKNKYVMIGLSASTGKATRPAIFQHRRQYNEKQRHQV